MDKGSLDSDKYAAASPIMHELYSNLGAEVMDDIINTPSGSEQSPSDFQDSPSPQDDTLSDHSDEQLATGSHSDKQRNTLKSAYIINEAQECNPLRGRARESQQLSYQQQPQNSEYGQVQEIKQSVTQISDALLRKAMIPTCSLASDAQILTGEYYQYRGYMTPVGGASANMAATAVSATGASFYQPCSVYSRFTPDQLHPAAHHVPSPCQVNSFIQPATCLPFVGGNSYTNFNAYRSCLQSASPVLRAETASFNTPVTQLQNNQSPIEMFKQSICVSDGSSNIRYAGGIMEDDRRCESSDNLTQSSSRDSSPVPQPASRMVPMWQSYKTYALTSTPMHPSGGMKRKFSCVDADDSGLGQELASSPLMNYNTQPHARTSTELQSCKVSTSNSSGPRVLLQPNVPSPKPLAPKMAALLPGYIQCIETPSHYQPPSKCQRNNNPLRDRAVRLMSNWYENHQDNPYPSKEDKEHIAREGGITVSQVKSWFANKRNRSNNTRPKVQKRKLEEKLMGICKQLTTETEYPPENNSALIQQLSSILREGAR